MINYKKKQSATHTVLRRDGCAYSTILEPIYIITGTLTCVGWIHFRENYILCLTDTETRESINKLSYVRTSKVIIFMYKIVVVRYPPVISNNSNRGYSCYKNEHLLTFRPYLTCPLSTVLSKKLQIQKLTNTFT